MERDNKKIFDTYVFISTFSRCLIETFIPVILYKFGFSIKELLLYFLVFQITSLILSYPFTYIFGKRLDFKKKDYIQISTIFICVVYFCKINVTYILLLIVSFIEGFATKMYELSENKAMYSLSKKFEYNSYNLAYEVTQNIFRLALATFFYFCNFDIKTMMYITLAVIASSALFKFKEPNIPNLDMDKIMKKDE